MEKVYQDRSYQGKAVNDIIAAFKENPVARVLLVSATGTGKTVMCRNTILSPELYEILTKGKNRDYARIVYKCHQKRLLTQGARTFKDPIVKTSSMSNWRDPEYNTDSGIKIEIVYQMYSEKLLPDDEIDLIVYDECQHEACNTIQEFLENAGKFPALGMTATPDREDNCLIKFDVRVEPLSRREAVQQGFICEGDIYTIVDSSNKDKLTLACQILDEYHHMMGQTMIFVRTRAEISKLVNYINENIGEGLAEGCDDATTDIDDLLDLYAEGEFKFIVSCNKLSEGVDISGVTDVFIVKNVGSKIVLNQIIGRAARIETNECRVWEFINPLSVDNISALEIIEYPKSHHIVNKVNGEFIMRKFG